MESILYVSTTAVQLMQWHPNKYGEPETWGKIVGDSLMIYELRAIPSISNAIIPLQNYNKNKLLWDRIL